MGIGTFVKAKVLAIVLSGLVVVGGGAAVFAATPAGQHALHAFTSSKGDATEAPDATEQHGTPTTPTCAGQPDAEQLATQFGLSTASDSDALKAICELHAGTFTGTTPTNTAVSASRVYGYGEIDMLLTFAKALATKNGTTLTTGTARSYLADALNTCGTMPIEPCLMNNGVNPGTGTGNGTGNGKPTTIPTPPPHPDPTPHH